MDQEEGSASGERFGNYHDRWAEIYDDWNPQFDEGMISTLADLARGGRALELRSPSTTA